MDRPRKKKIVFARFWKKQNKQFTGYLDFGGFGRLQATMIQVEQKSDNDPEFMILLENDATPFGMLRQISGKIDDALFEDDENSNPYENQ
jgi:hypothetical protein